MFFHAYMYGPLQGKLRLYKARDVRPAGKVMPSDWEVFASILVKDVGKKLSSGVDLSAYEVKSAEKGGGFEYQYHKIGGKKKLAEDMSVGHLFFEHADNLQWVELRYLHGTALQAFFSEWLADFPEPYKQQRYRRQISNAFVRKNGTLLMRLVKGEVEYPELKPSTAEESSAEP
ncbi:MAG TPA: hypothetical protein VFQ00_12355 [Terriglobales bacterium]|nr:hypothetical protein [Terriglobales bacterium]